MIKFIPTDYDFEVDLTFLELTFNEQNSILSKENSSAYSFPFTMNSDFWDKVTNLHTTAADRVTSFQGLLNLDGEIVTATLKLETKKGNQIPCIILAGVEKLPSFDTNLSDLDLDTFDVPNIKDHALDVINQDWPAVTHNFPMIHTDSYDPTGEEFFEFGQIINKFESGAFVESILNEEGVDEIRNIMQPFPYLLHVLKKGFEASGKNLQGDVLTDPSIKTALLIRDGKYYNSLSKEEINLTIKNAENEGVEYVKSGIEHVKFQKDFIVEKKGDYILFGQIVNLIWKANLLGVNMTDIDIKIHKISGGISTLLYSWEVNGVDGIIDLKKSTKIRNIDIDVSLEVGDIIRVYKIEPRRDQLPESITPEYPDAAYLKLVPVRYRYPDGSPILSVLDINKIELTKCVPDIKFGDLVDIVSKYWNLYLKEDGDTVYLNYVNLSNRTNAIDMSSTEIAEPLQTFKDERSYELMFTDGKSNTNYLYDSMYFKKELTSTNNYTPEKTSTPISIDALPYPIITRNGVTTAIAFDNEPAKVRFAFYKSNDVGDEPVCYNNQNATIPGLYNQRYKDWINFMLNSTPFEWDFIISVERWRNISINSIIYAYDNFHLFSEIEKQRINRLYWRISAKTETIS